MGFDVYGLKPETDIIPDQPDWSRQGNEEEAKAYFAWQTNTPGAYFRNNVWWWRPLWNYISFMCDDILTEKDMTEGEMNNGHIISKTKSKKIAARIRKLDKKGEILRYQMDRKKSLDKLKLIECQHCNGTGMRDDEFVKGKCNGCKGKGKTKPFIADYPFSVTNVRNFAQFCEKSGGFEIC
tara:strand:- start:691 stop:1233 length:543 start_codon:yes stop_codon:yes gene_type:complete